MGIEKQWLIPAVRTIKDYESLVNNPAFDVLILLDSHIAQLQSLVKLARDRNKQVIVHADLVHGLKSDEHGAQFLCQVIRPAGLISTHTQVVTMAKKSGLLGIQRIFLLDSHALATSYRILQSSKPDIVEVLPGVVTAAIQEIRERTGLPVLAGGFIRTAQDVKLALDAGASAITTSNRELWKLTRQEVERI